MSHLLLTIWRWDSLYFCFLLIRWTLFLCSLWKVSTKSRFMIFFSSIGFPSAYQVPHGRLSGRPWNRQLRTNESKLSCKDYHVPLSFRVGSHYWVYENLLSEQNLLIYYVWNLPAFLKKKIAFIVRKDWHKFCLSKYQVPLAMFVLINIYD